MYQYIRSIGVFKKIALIVLLFSGITYFLSNRLNDSQYSAQDMLMEYQNFVLYQMMVEKWNNNFNDKEALMADLEKMQLSTYIGTYYDTNNNQELDLGIDTLLNMWSYRQNKNSFHYNDYERHGVYQILADSLGVSQDVKIPYASYGFFGEEQLPSTFIELLSKENEQQIRAYWLITDYPLPPDISWPEIVLAFAVLFILGLTFIIIRTFLQPIQTMIQHVKKLKRGTLNTRIPITTNDELGELSDTINKMTEDINVLVNQKQNLLIDVSHELKTPLTRLKFIIANMEELNNLDKDAINKEINFLQDMISNMLLSDRLSTPYIEDLEKKEILLKDLIKNACDMFYQIEKKIKIVTENEHEDITLFVDSYKMSLALKNLIDNALKYGSDNQIPELRVVIKNQEVIIQVTDFGEGITREQLEKITKPLYRGRAAKEKSKTGFGLGLAIAKKIVEAHNGKLNITSKLGQGATFMIIIPKMGVNNEKH